ncbi:MAG TPA: DNA gyrase inhibitor YacG [Acidobacteriaceae bacterium]|nr:DNA gyrase inhibitor YacG [Acidobacteriaceae bacterium]
MSAKPLHCPICKKPVDPSSNDAPFCSDRCRLIDLGKWASGDYRVSSPILDPELLEEVEEAQLHAERRRAGHDKD